jgi:hypothetical protein
MTDSYRQAREDVRRLIDCLPPYSRADNMPPQIVHAQPPLATLPAPPRQDLFWNIPA